MFLFILYFEIKFRTVKTSVPCSEHIVTTNKRILIFVKVLEKLITRTVFMMYGGSRDAKN